MKYQRLTLKNVRGLAAPHTWVAAVFPVLLGSLLSVALENSFSLIIFLMVLAAAILLQSSVNTLNDYYDFIKGTDQAENSDDPDDAVLVYNDLNPKHVMLLGFTFMAAAILLGVYPVYRGGIMTLLLGVIGCVIVVAYSAGKLPISYMPLGELFSGGVMGGLITMAVFSAFTGYAGLEILCLSTPLIIGIGLIMMTNNTCDIERDYPIGRKTLPLLLGRGRARALYRFLSGVWLALVIAITALWFPKGAPIMGLILLASFPVLRRLFRSPLLPSQRGLCMGSILKANICIYFAYLMGVLAHILRK